MKSSKIKDFFTTIIAYIIVGLICSFIIMLFLLILRFMGWLLTWESIRTSILILGAIGSLIMIFNEFREEE